MAAVSTIRMTARSRARVRWTNALWNDEALARLKIDLPTLEIDDEVPVEDKKELIVLLMFVPVILALHDAEAYDRVIYFAESLVVPAIRACTDKRRDVDNAERRELDVKERGVRVVLGTGHENILSFMFFAFRPQENRDGHAIDRVYSAGSPRRSASARSVAAYSGLRSSGKGRSGRT